MKKINQTFNSYYLEMEIEEQEYKRLKSREEKLLAYYGWFVDKENDLATVEDIVNENIELHNTLEDVYKEKRKLGEQNKKLKEEKEIRALNDRDNLIQIEKLEQENRKLKEELKKDDREVQVDVDKELLKANDYLIKENKNLKESLDIATKCSSKEEDGIIRLSEENKKLKADLDKFSEAYKKYRDYEKEELAESCYDLARENEKLKDIICKIVYLYKEEPTELEEYIKSGFKGGMSN